MPPAALHRDCPISLGLMAALVALMLSACGEIWNNPYPRAQGDDNTLYTSFSERPKHLDPAQSYAEDEAEFLAQIYEPPFQYHYLKRPYELVPATVTQMPVPRYRDRDGRELAAEAPAEAIATSEYDIRIRGDIRFQPHPAFVESNRRLDPAAIRRAHALTDLGATGSRLLTAHDYVYQIKRLAHPKVNSPIYGHMTDYIVGLKEFGDVLKGAQKALDKEGRAGAWLDLRGHDLAGVRVIDDTTFRVTVKGKYPQFLYWMAMSFFAPVPWEAEAFYAQPGMAERNFNLDWYPVGTGPYMLAENNPNARMVLARNPNFRGEAYPSAGEAGDADAGLLKDAGKTMPFIDRAVFTREKETIPYWNKFLQGYYDRSGIASDNFDQAVKAGTDGETTLTPEMESRGIRLRTSLATSSYYLAFNWQDPVVGGSGDKARKLRQAVSIAIDFDEFIAIFLNGRGIAGQGPVPPGIFGFREGKASVNPVVYDWVADAGAAEGGKARRKDIATAKRLLAEAGFPDGRDAVTGQPLVLALDTTDRGPGDKARLDWYRKQFARINVQLEVRGTDWNRFQEKIRKGNTQMFFLGWNADYPDPENFLFLLYGPNSAIKADGENKANYANPEFDRLFVQMKDLPNGPERQAVIDRMVDILRMDAPWAWGFHPKSYALAHAWVANGKPNQMARNSLKYQRVDAALRAQKRAEWNRPVVWPFILLALVAAALVWMGLRYWRRAEGAVALENTP